MSCIIPRSKAKGTDICSVEDRYYIIRSDLGCYMQTSNLHEGADISVFGLHPACQNGDHYIGDGEGYFYIIKGDSYRRVSNLTTDSDAEVYDLHPNCQGGDHYFRVNLRFYIIFQEKFTLRVTAKLNRDPRERPLDPNFRGGLYYWGHRHKNALSGAAICFLKPASKWGVEFCEIEFFHLDFITDRNLRLFLQGEYIDNYPKTFTVYSVHPDVLNFLPGGLSVTKGPATGRWENIKTVTNDSNTPVKWQKKITKKVGYNKQKMAQITHNWKIAASASTESGKLAKLIAKLQFSFSAEYGGSYVSAENESWNEATEEEELLSFVLKPSESVYLWQYRLGLGQESVLFCRDLKITNKSNPPAEVPLPPVRPR